MQKPRSMPMYGLAALSLILVAIFTGCPGTGQSSLTWEQVHTGSQGVMLYFSENAPPPVVNPGRIFYIDIVLQNLGAYSLKQGEGFARIIVNSDYMSLTGQSAQYLKKPYSFSLYGRSMFQPKGELNEKFFTGQSVKLVPLPENQADIVARLCYSYQTELSASVCLDTDPFKIRLTPEPCTPRDLEPQDQGAPVAVTKVLLDMRPEGTDKVDYIMPEFTIFVENLGQGLVFNNKLASPEEVCTRLPDGKCPEEEPDCIFDSTTVKASLAGSPLECGDGIVKLKEGQNFITCRTQEKISASQQNFMTTLTVTVNYGYMQNFVAPLVVAKNLNRASGDSE